MKFKSCRTILVFIIFVAMMSCTRTSDTTNQFITDFLNQKSVLVYKSEIQRTRVNFFPNSKMLVYSFWKKEVFNKNGDLFLHLYLKDTTLLPETRKEYGFINLSIKNEDILLMDSLNLYMLKNLSSYGELESFVTGQFIGTKRTWFAKHQTKSALLKQTSTQPKIKDIEVKMKLDSRNNTILEAMIPEYKMSFLNNLIITDAIQIFNQKNALNVFLSKDNTEAYLTFNLDSIFFKHKYSLCFFEERKNGSVLEEITLFNEDTLNYNFANNKVLALKIKVPNKAKRIALLRKELGKSKVLISTYID